MSDKIIRSTYGGLGDSLQHSTLPRRFTELGFDVYVSSQIPYRNPDIKKLVWDLNPYIKGFSDAAPNAGDIEGIYYRQYNHGFIGNWECAHGLGEPYSEIPEIYYVPNEVKEVKDKVLIDVTTITAKPLYDGEKLRKFVTWNYDKKDVMMCIFPDGLTFPMFLLEGYDAVYVKDLFYYLDLIYSCKRFVCLFSGGASAAASLFKYKKIYVECICTDNPVLRSAEITSLHSYKEINYIWM